MGSASARGNCLAWFTTAWRGLLSTLGFRAVWRGLQAMARQATSAMKKRIALALTPHKCIMIDLLKTEKEIIMQHSKKMFLLIFASILLLSGVTLADNTNMVDERFELVSLVFRLAEHQEYSEEVTDYQKEISETFTDFSKHPIVSFTKTLPFGYDAVFKFAVHIINEDGQFAFIEDIDSLLDDGRWTKETASIFLENGYLLD